MRWIFRCPETRVDAACNAVTQMALSAGLAATFLLPIVSSLAVGQAAPPAKNNAADVAFMAGMIHHHAQAIEMVALMAGRTKTPVLTSLGERINVSQKDEIAMMQQWLRDHGEAVPDPLAHAHMNMDMGKQPMMPGMLSKAQMSGLAKAQGAAFDRLFLTGMIQHHTGALTMVRELFAANGAAQNTAVFRFASDVDADQRAEITRMRALLKVLPTH
jgi:uncharacterized protein (DUF305 family)